MASYILAQVVSALAVVAVAVLAVRRYTTRTDAALRAALDGIDTAARAVLGGAARPILSGVGLNGSHTANTPAVSAGG